MDTTKKTAPKIKMTIHLSAAAVDVLRFAGYASDRTVGEFISRLIVEHHERTQQAKSKAPPTRAQIAAELRALAAAVERAK
jgi:hypothetical protein